MRNDWRTAAIDGDHRLIERLLADGADIDARDRYGQTVLMLAAMHGCGEVVRVLVQRAADLDVTAKYGLSALMLAVVNGHVDIAKHLVDAGADTRIRGSGAPGFAGKTASDMAEDGGLDDLATYIAAADGQGPDRG